MSQIQPEHTVVVAVDDTSISEYGSWPWSRDFQAEVIAKIRQTQPKKIVVDVIYPGISTDNEKDVKLLQELRNGVVLATDSNNFEAHKKIGLNVGSASLEINPQNSVVVQPADGNGIPSLTNQVLGTGFSQFNLYPKFAKPLVISVKQLMQLPESNNLLRNKIVFFGGTNNALKDNINLSFQNSVPGVIVQAWAVDQVLQARKLEIIKYSWLIRVSILFGLALLNLFLFSRFSFRSFILLMLVQDLIILAIFWILLHFKNIALEPDFLLAVGVIQLVIMAIVAGIYLWLDRVTLMQTMRKYIPIRVADTVIYNKKIPSLESKKQIVSILFSDIRGFTTFSEKMEDEYSLSDSLNQLLTLQANVIQELNGTLDKYLGDAVMAFWGAPDTNENHAFDALRAAVKIQSNILDFQIETGIPLEVSIGVNTGFAMVGNFGSSQRLDYTVIGDTVNTTGRIESIAKVYGAKILVSENTLHSLNLNQQEQFEWHEVDHIRLKGKSKSIRLYEVLIKPDLQMTDFGSNISHSDTKHRHLLKRYSKCLRLYYAGKFEEAAKLAAKIELTRAKVILNRCQQMLSNPPQDWVGVWEFDHK
ncbi:MAG: hypothetical protein OHK0017_03400 [Patescibacteria group bacterium]